MLSSPSLSIFCIYYLQVLANAQYTLQKDYFASNFFDSFNFFSGADPTNGFVSYQGEVDSLISSSSNNAQMRVSTEQSTPNGRPSIRITSKDAYQTGLIILDLDHMPGGICGTWPAFWTFGPNWPTDGEIDIIEGVNEVQTNQVTLHTGETCSAGPADMTGSISTSNCDVSNGDNSGCGITTTDTATYGSAFNSNHGGVYATSITSNNIIVWFFPRDAIPSDITNDSPNPASWSTPLANFSGPCDFSTAFSPQNLVFDTTFCGDWAGETWSSSSCAAKADTCENYVANNGADFDEAYWSINGLKVFQESGSAPSSVAPPPPPQSTTTSSPPPPPAQSTTTSSPPPPPAQSITTSSPPPPPATSTIAPSTSATLPPPTSAPPSSPPTTSTILPPATTSSPPAPPPETANTLSATTTRPSQSAPTTFETVHWRPGQQPAMTQEGPPAGPPGGQWDHPDSRYHGPPGYWHGGRPGGPW